MMNCNLTEQVPEILQYLITDYEWQGTKLDLSWTRGRSPNYDDISPEGVEALAKWEGHTLNLDGEGIGDEGAIDLGVNWKGTTLSLYYNHISDEGAEYLAKWGGHTLNLGDNKIGLEGAKALAKWKGHTLRLSSNYIGPDSAKVLARWKGHTLDLGENRIGPEGAKHLAKWKGTTLLLRGSKIGLEGAKALAKWKGTTIDLRGSDIGDEGVRFLTEKWRGHILYLHGNYIIDVKKTFIRQIKERYTTTLMHTIGNYFCKDISTYIIGKLLEN